MAQRVMRIGEIASTPTRKGKLPVSPATIWRWSREEKSDFPKPFKLSASVTVWDADAIDVFIAKRASISSQVSAK